MAQFSNIEAPKNQQWSTGLYDCCNDWYICGQSNYCLYGENVRKLTGGGFCGPCCLMCWCSYFSCCFANTTRADIRAKYGLPAEPCGDCVVHWCCSPCAICQEARELRVRDGWKTWHD